MSDKPSRQDHEQQKPVNSGFIIQVRPLTEDGTDEGTFYMQLLDISFPSLPICDMRQLKEEASIFEDFAQAAAIGWSYADQDYITGERCFDGFKIEFIQDGTGSFFSRDFLKDYVSAMGLSLSDRAAAEQAVKHAYRRL